jgi:hypothetical protein
MNQKAGFTIFLKYCSSQTSQEIVMEIQDSTISSPYRKLFINVGIAITALVIIISLQRNQIDRARQSSLNPQQDEQQKALQLQLLKRLPTFGFDNLIADWAFLDFLQYFGDVEARNVTGYQLHDDYFDLITQRDPRFVDVYPFLSTAVSFYLGKPELAVKYMDRGTNALSPKIDPDSYLIWRYKALDQLLLLGDVPGAIQSIEMSAKWVEGTPDQEYAPLFQQTADFLKTDPDSKMVRFQSWIAVYYGAVDQKVQERAKQEIVKLGGDIRQDQKGEIYFVPPESEMR